MIVSEITVHELVKLRAKDSNIFLLDVRTPEEHAISNLGGCLMPLYELPTRLEELDRQQHIIVYCRSGGRSHRATEFLMEQGFKNVHNLYGGMVAWTMEIVPS